MREFLEFWQNGDDGVLANPIEGYTLHNVQDATISFDLGDGHATVSDAMAACNTIELSGNTGGSNRTIKLPYDASSLRGCKTYVVRDTSVGSTTSTRYYNTFTTGAGRRVAKVPQGLEQSTLNAAMFLITVDAYGNVDTDTSLVGENSYGTWIKDRNGLTTCFGSFAITTGSSVVWNNFYEGTATFYYPVTLKAVLFIKAVPINHPSMAVCTLSTVGLSSCACKIFASNASTTYTCLFTVVGM